MELVVLFIDLLLIAGALWLASMAVSMRTVAPYVRTSGRVALEVATALSSLPDGSVFYELGAGDGRVLFSVARENPSIHCIGVEKYLVPYLLLSLRALVSQLPNVSVRREDIYETPLENATHLYAYLYPQVLDALLPKLVATLAPGALLLSLDFAFSDKEATYVRDVPGTRARLFGYTF